VKQVKLNLWYVMRLDKSAFERGGHILVKIVTGIFFAIKFSRNFLTYSTVIMLISNNNKNKIKIIIIVHGVC